MSIPNLQICPNPSCPNPTDVEISQFRVYVVVCAGCGMAGPMALKHKNKTEAVKLWNGIIRGKN